MPLYDATLPMVQGMVTFPGDPPFKMEPFFLRKKGDPFNIALLSMGTHLGTYVDPPVHYLEGGTFMEVLLLETLVGPGYVVDMRGVRRLDREVLEVTLPECLERVLFNTDSGPWLLEHTFRVDLVHLTETGARFLVQRGMRIVGADGSPERVVLWAP